MSGRRVGIAEVLALTTVSDPRWSPDGRLIACSVSRPDLAANRERSAIWLVDPDGASPAKQLTAGTHADRLPRFSPDGRSLAFVSNRSGTDRVWVIPMDGGEASPLLEGEAERLIGPVATDDFYAAIEWRPDGQAIGFVAQQPPPPAPDQADPDATDAKVVGRIDGEGYGEIQRLQVWQVSWPGREPRQLTSGDFHHGDFRWLPDSRRIVLVSNRSGDEEAVRFSVNKDYNLYLLEVESGELSALTSNPGPDFSPRPSPDGSRIAYLRIPRRGSHSDSPSLALISTAGGDAVTLSDPEGPHLERLTSDCWSADGASLCLSAGARAASHLLRVSIVGGEPEVLHGGDSLAQWPALSPEGARVAFVYQSPTRPPEVAVIWADGGEPRIISAFNESLGGIDLGSTETHRWQSADGVEVEGLVLVPPGRVSERSPLLVIPHGGPHSRSTLGFMVEWQYWAARGFAVFAPNFRGSIGYGQKYVDLDRGDFGGGDFADLMSGIDALVSAGVADPERLAIMGGSYGGFMTVWAIGHTDAFKAAVSICAVVDLASMYGQTDIPSWVEWEFGLPWRVRETLVAHSPLTHVHQGRTPTLIVHGDADLRVPLAQSQQLHGTLKRLGVACEFVRYPREGHGIREPRHRRDLFRRVGEWLERYVLA